MMEQNLYDVGRYERQIAFMRRELSAVKSKMQETRRVLKELKRHDKRNSL